MIATFDYMTMLTRKHGITGENLDAISMAAFMEWCADQSWREAGITRDVSIGNTK